MHDGVARHFVHYPNGKHTGYGVGTKIFNDDLGFRSCYAHGMEDGWTVSDGAFVAAGTPILLSGNTGNSTGPHAHVDCRWLDHRKTNFIGHRLGFFDFAPYFVANLANPDPLKNLYDQKQLVEWAWQEVWDNKDDPVKLQDALERTRIVIEEMRGNIG